MNGNIRFSELTSTGQKEPMNKRYDTHIVSDDGNWDWKPIQIETPSTWSNLVKRVRGEA